ncbi:MAG: hypothetical protein ACP5KO_06965, partial [Caldimicrobium sp.]
MTQMVQDEVRREGLEGNLYTKELIFEDYPIVRSLYGERGSHFKILEEAFRVKLILKGNHIIITGEPEDLDLTEKTLEELYSLI